MYGIHELAGFFPTWKRRYPRAALKEKAAKNQVNKVNVSEASFNQRIYMEKRQPDRRIQPKGHSVHSKSSSEAPSLKVIVIKDVLKNTVWISF
jgi:hypothetical protein